MCRPTMLHHRMCQIEMCAALPFAPDPSCQEPARRIPLSEFGLVWAEAPCAPIR
jgi:hypothetical protein